MRQLLLLGNKVEIIKPILKWAGGKEKELDKIQSFLPENIEKYVEPFVGGGSVFLNIGVENSFINDKSTELIRLYNCIKENDKKFFDTLNEFNKSWKKLEDFADSNPEILIDLYFEKTEVEDFISEHKDNFKLIIKNKIYIEKSQFLEQLNKNLKSKISKTKKIAEIKGHITEKEIVLNMETALKSSFYMYIRYLYNLNLKNPYNLSFSSAVFYFIREYCYASMFRYSSKGMFNVPYGGMSYNRKNFQSKIDYLKSKTIQNKLKSTVIENLDFEEFINSLDLRENDFIFIDPPYDTEFSTYSKNQFDRQDQIRLANCLKKVKAKFMVVIKNTDFIYDLYKDFNIKIFDKKYLVSFKNRNNKDVQHLIIMNYGD